MRETIFDLVEDEVPEGKEGYMEVASRAPQPKEKSFLNDMSDYAKTFVKGGVEGISRLGKVMGGLKHENKTSEQELKEQTETLNKELPTEEGYIQSSLRRGLNIAPTVLASSGSTLAALPRSILAGFSGEAAKELGLPEWAQAAAEITAFVTPDITKKLLSSGKNSELIDFAKKMGMTDEQITPLIQSDFKQKWLSKLSPKRGRTQEVLEDTKKSLGNAYDSIQKSPAAAKEISEISNGKLINLLKEKINEMPAGVKENIEKDLMELLNNKITGRTLINFWKDINSASKGDNKQIVAMKPAIKEALQSLDPALAKDFEMVNELYTKFYPISSKLKPNMASDILSGVEALGMLGAMKSVLYGDFTAMAAMLGEKAARYFSREMLINPHLQQLAKKTITALNESKFGIATKLFKSIGSKISKKFSGVSDELEKISEEDLKDLFTHQQKEK